MFKINALVLEVWVQRDPNALHPVKKSVPVAMMVQASSCRAIAVSRRSALVRMGWVQSERSALFRVNIIALVAALKATTRMEITVTKSNALVRMAKARLEHPVQMMGKKFAQVAMLAIGKTAPSVH